MSTRVLALAFVWAMSALHCAAQPLLRVRNSPAIQSPEAVRAAFNPWLRAVQGLLTPVRYYEVYFDLRIIRNPALTVTVGEAALNVLAQRVLAPPPDTTRLRIGVIVLQCNENLLAGRWQQPA